MLGQLGCVATADETTPNQPEVKTVTHVEGRSDPLPPPLASPGSDRLALDQATAQGSNAALILFLARFPDSAVADAARATLRQRHSPDPAGVAEQVAGTDAGVVRDFDTARLEGPQGLERFLTRHASHPLAAEVRRWLSGG